MALFFVMEQLFEEEAQEKRPRETECHAVECLWLDSEVVQKIGWAARIDERQGYVR